MKSFVAIALVSLTMHVRERAHAASAPTPEEVEDRIGRVINGLLPDAALEDQYAPKSELKQRMAFYHTPGVSIAVINDHRIEWARGFGVKESGKREPVTETTLFQAGSISKPIFALAVMLLVQEGKIDLDEGVNRYLTSWKVPAQESWQPRITLRQLLSHTGGFTVHGFLGYESKDKLPTLVDVIEGRPPAQTPRIEVNVLPGTQFRYSGGGITVAQLAVQDVVRQPFARIMRERVLDPLGMTHSTYEQPLPRTWQRQAAVSHPWKNHPIDGKWYIHPEQAAAGLWTTPSDLARALLELQLLWNGKTNGFLSPAHARAMLTPRSSDVPVGVGFFVWGEGATAAFGHNGKNEGAEAIMSAYKKTGKGAVIMINSNEGSPLLGEIQRAIAREYDWPGYRWSERASSKLSPDFLAGYEGEYVAKSGLKFTIMNRNGTLFLAYESQQPVQLRPSSETNFFISTLNTEVTFHKNEHGEVKSLSVLQEERQILAERKL